MAKPLQQGISTRHHLGTCVHSVWGLLYQLSLSSGDLTSLVVQSGPGALLVYNTNDTLFGASNFFCVLLHGSGAGTNIAQSNLRSVGTCGQPC